MFPKGVYQNKHTCATLHPPTAACQSFRPIRCQHSARPGESRFAWETFNLSYLNATLLKAAKQDKGAVRRRRKCVQRVQRGYVWVRAELGWVYWGLYGTVTGWKEVIDGVMCLPLGSTHHLSPGITGRMYILLLASTFSLALGSKL